MHRLVCPSLARINAMRILLVTITKADSGRDVAVTSQIITTRLENELKLVYFANRRHRYGYRKKAFVLSKPIETIAGDCLADAFANGANRNRGHVPVIRLVRHFDPRL